MPTLTSRVAMSILGILGIVSLLYLMIAFDPAYGRPVAPLDDAYITFQYARQIARGQPYRYNDGDPPTTGMTSPLFGFLLAGVYALGMRGELLPAAAVALGVAWLALTVWLTYRITFHLLDAATSKRWAWMAALLVALTGTVQWGCFNGMETGLFTVLTLAAIATWLSRRVGWSALWLALAALIRPEGQALAALIWTLTLVGPLVLSLLSGGDADGYRRRPIHWRHLALLTIALLAGFVPMVVNRHLTGTASSAGLLAKAWFHNVPAIPGEIARSVWFSYRDILFQRLMGLGRLGRWFAPPGLLVLALIGGASLGRRRAWEQLVLLIIWLFGGTLSSALLMTATWHLGRYQVPFVPIAIILAVCGLAALEGQGTRRWQRIVVGVVALGMVVVSIYSTRHFLMLYRRSVATTARQQLVIADWIRAYLPPEARVGVHDTGSLRYVGERPTYDLVGLTTPDAAIAWRHGAGSVFELMETSPLRPTHFAIYPDVFSIPYLAVTDLFGEELFRAEVPDYAVASAGPVQGIWRADWTLAGSGDDLYQADVRAQLTGLTLMDTLDVADLADEDAHQVRWWHEALRPGFPTEVLQLAYRTDPEIEVLDGGRLLTGGIAFEIVTQPHSDLWLVARLHAHEAGVVRVEVGGREIGTWAYPPVPGQWLETRFHVPAEAIDASRTEVVLRVDPDVPGFQHYAPYYFWFLQGELPASTEMAAAHVTAEFEEALVLQDFDLSGRTWHAGEVVPLTLHWQAQATTESPAKVFLHLYDATGSLRAQSDGWAFYGTRPPYTWRPGKTVHDPHVLPLPADLPAGRYTLEVGLYHPEEGGRLQATVDGMRQPEGRVVLAELVVSE